MSPNDHEEHGCIKNLLNDGEGYKSVIKRLDL